jgi:hypothetical protein
MKLGFHMSGAATSPNTPNKEVIIGEGQRQNVYYVPRTRCGKRLSKHLAHLQPSSRSRHELSGDKRSALLNCLVTGMAWMVTIWVLVLGGVQRSCHCCHHLRGAVWSG